MAIRKLRYLVLLPVLNYFRLIFTTEVIDSAIHVSHQKIWSTDLKETFSDLKKQLVLTQYILWNKALQVDFIVLLPLLILVWYIKYLLMLVNVQTPNFSWTKQRGINLVSECLKIGENSTKKESVGMSQSKFLWKLYLIIEINFHQVSISEWIMVFQ